MSTITTSQGASPLLWFLTTSLNLRDSQSVKPKAFRKRLLYVCAPPSVITQGLSAFSENDCKDKKNY